MKIMLRVRLETRERARFGRCQPAPPPGHPQSTLNGWPGGGAGWHRKTCPQHVFKKTLSAALAASLLAAFGASAPAFAQSGAPVPTMVIYGTQKCPTDADGNEIVVCVRRKPGEQFRIPKELRDLKVTPENESWTAKSAANADAGAGGIGSCSTVGPGGSTGCLAQRGMLYKREKQDKKADQRAVEAALP